MDLKQELLNAVGALNRAGVPYALCGGMAVVLHGYPRLTRDIDLLIRPQELEAAKAALATAGFSISGGLIPFDTGGPHERKVFRLSKRIGEDLLTIDLLLLPPFLRDIWEDCETYKLDGVPVTVVDRSGLIAMKKIAGRHQDLSDIENLESTP
jgi:predicted nucleotidyltransferase